MSDETNATPNPEQPHATVDSSWQEVGRQFETLGATLSQVLRTTWNRVETNADAQQIKGSLETLLRDVGKAVEDAAATPEAQKLKDEAKRTAESLRIAGEQSVQEARPQIISALKQINDELTRLIQKVEDKP